MTGARLACDAEQYPTLWRRTIPNIVTQNNTQHALKLHVLTLHKVMIALMDARR